MRKINSLFVLLMTCVACGSNGGGGDDDPGELPAFV